MDEQMEKRNVISPDRTPTMDKQSSMDDMEKEAVDVFAKSANIPAPKCATNGGCKSCKAAQRGKV